MLVLVVGVVIRLVLLPRASGLDFHVWDATARAALQGINVYATPPLPVTRVGPYAYFPLYLYILMPLRALATMLGLPFVILGKLPVVIGDTAAAVAIAMALRAAGLKAGRVAFGAALFFLNPLVLYNGAFYGRFDSLVVAVLLLAWLPLARGVRGTWAGPLWYGVAVALKTFPLFLIPFVLLRRRHQAPRFVVAACVIPCLTALPFLIWSPRQFANLVFLYDASKGPRQFSWQYLLLQAGMSERAATVVSYGLLLGFVVAAILLAWSVADPYVYSALSLALFLLLSKVVYEQYLLWVVPFLAILVARDRDWYAAGLLGVVSVVGLLANPWVHPWGYRPAPALWLNMALAVALSGFVLLDVVTRRGSDSAATR